MKKTIEVKGMTCGHCVKRVENAVSSIEGVQSVTVSLENKNVVVESFGEIDNTILKEAIEDVGYEVGEIQ